MEGSARVGVINEPDVQLLAASKGFFLCVFFKRRDQRGWHGAAAAQAAAVWAGQGRAGQHRPVETLRDVTLAFFGLINTDSDEMFQTEVALDIVFWGFFPGTLRPLSVFVQPSSPTLPTPRLSLLPPAVIKTIFIKGKCRRFFCYYFGTITAVAALDLEVDTLRPLELLVTLLC